MENRYLFRAKRIDTGEWVIGYLSYPHCMKKGNESYYFYAKDSLGFYCRCVVAASTICRCTGLRDKNGKLIWEKDILMAYLDEDHPEDVTYAKIEWNGSGWVTHENNNEDQECGIRSEHCKACIAKKAIEIVKGGGMDDSQT